MKKGIVIYDISTLKLKDSIVEIIEESATSYTVILLEKGSKKCLVNLGTVLTINKLNINLI